MEFDQALSQCWVEVQKKPGHAVIDEIIDDDDIAHERIEDPELEPLIDFTPRPITMPASAKYTK